MGPNIDNKITNAVIGLVTDLASNNLKEGMVTDALNANIESYNGEALEYSNDAGNSFCFIVPEGYKVINKPIVIPSISKVFYCLANPTTGNSIIGYTFNDQCIFNILLDDSISGSDLLHFNINSPIHQGEVKTTNCSTQIYFTDNLNPRRFLDLDNLPWKTTLSGGTITPLVGQIDTNKMLVQPVFSVPEIHASKESIGGNVIEGDYQFAIQYSNVDSEGLTGFYSVTNPVRVFQSHHMSPDFNLVTNNSITLDISDLDTTGLYSYFNLAVIKTINGALAGVDLVGTFPILNNTYTHTYTGLEQSNSNIKLDMTQIMTKYNYYDKAGIITQVDNKLIYGDLTKEEDNSFQEIWSQVKVGWGTSQMPTGEKIGYHDGTVCANFEGYHRDEVYALEGCFIEDNGREFAKGHIPGREANPFDLQPVPFNSDVAAINLGTCPTPILPRWKVYNTGSVIGSLTGSSDPCNGIKPWQYGEMSYWESTEKYPNKPSVWGPLANQPIRHHKFPDNIICPIHDDVSGAGDSYMNENVNVYPIGFKIDINSIWNALQASTSISAEQKRRIVGFKIMRSDRGANRSIIASGILNNCGKYTKDGTSYYYANYPFNDLNPDVFISSIPVNDKSGNNANSRLNDFQGSRYTFHSPDTHFDQPRGIQDSFLKLETAEYGKAKIHFVQVENNAKEQIITPKALEVAIAGGLLASIGANVDYTSGTSSTLTITPSTNFANFFPTYNNMLEIINKLIPYYQYGWQYNAIGRYGQSINVPNDLGNKIRYINYGGYITSGVNGTFGDDHSINNSFRESSVYVSLDNSLPFVNTVAPVSDNSRTTASIEGICAKSTPVYKDIVSYYANIKRDLPGQYGEIFSYVSVDTGTVSKFYDATGNKITDLPIVYGGDIFINEFALKIKHAFFLKNTVGLNDGTDIDYNQDLASNSETGNVGYPIWYYSTSNKQFTLSSFTSGQITNFINLFTTTGGILLTLFSVGLTAIIEALAIIAGLIADGLFTTPGLKITNLDCPNSDGLEEIGEAYLYAYGISRFFVESEVNVDMRQASNSKEGNFYPNVGTDIPDTWLQETNVPIAQDNTYIYNKTYSKQNKETFFQTLRADWEPNQSCFINYNNRVIWSEKSELEETRNNWLIYKPANMKDLPKTFGKLNCIDGIENKGILVRFENKSQMYNVMATVETTSLTAALGTGELFSGTAIDLSNTDIGDKGSQNKYISSNEHGHIFVDAKRGQVILLRGNEAEDLGGPKYYNSKWFSNNLPFNILKTFPSIDIDNNFNGIGLHGVYDSYYHRFILTKIDYEPIVDNIQWDGTNFYVDAGTTTGSTEIEVPGPKTCCPPGYSLYDSLELPCRSNDKPYSFTNYVDCPPTIETIPTTITETKIINLNDPNYFCNKSWTMSFSFLTNSWVSPHSFHPNFYVEAIDYFQAGINRDPISSVWDHNTSFATWNSYFGLDFPYIIEYPFTYKYEDEIVQSIKEYCTIIKYTDIDNFVEPNELIYFTNTIVYNNQQNSGSRNLVAQDNRNLAQRRQYPKYNSNSIDILYSKSDHFYIYNQIWDIVKNPDINVWNNVCGTTLGTKVLNDSNLNYTNQSFKKYPLRAKDSRVRHTLDRSDIKVISKFIVQQNQKSIK